MKILFFFWVYIFLTTANAQYAANSYGYVCDINTREPIPFATVKNITKRIAFYANERGEMNSEVNKGDTIIISCVGYEEMKMVVTARVDTFFLVPRQIVLKEVSVSTLALPEIRIGLVDKKLGFSVYNSGILVEYAIKFSLPKTKDYYKVKTILLKAKKVSDNNNRIRLHIYKPDKFGFPGEEILPKDILINNYNRKRGMVEIDISDLDFYVEDEIVFIGFECVGKANKEFSKNGSKIEFTWANTEPISYSRTLLDPEHKWHIMDATSPFAAHHKIKEQVPNIMASIIIQ